MNGVIKPLVTRPLKHLFKMMTVPEYFTHSLLWSRLGGLKRYTDCSAKINNWDLVIPDNISFLHSYREIFLEKIYAFKSDTQSPNILDLGANIGLSVLFFKSLYPAAKITAFEADPKIFKYLKKNISENGITDIKLINKAIWYENTELDFAAEGADAGKISTETGNTRVEAIDILEVLQSQEFDFLKMDIEGAEEFVFPRCQKMLPNFKFIFIEYHSQIGKEQRLYQILSLLHEAGFRVHIRNINNNNLSPFIEIKTQADFDLQLNVFAWKNPVNYC